MIIKFYDSMARDKREFIPIENKKVGIYSCGPTVYDHAHIGNLSAFLFVDILKRWLKFNGYEVYHVMNITDVDDKTIHGAKNQEVSLQKFTRKYTDIFMKELQLLNILPADVYPKATDHIKEMVSMIKKLLDNGYAYIKDGSVYFRIKSFPAYGQLAQLDMNNLKIGASVDADEYTKEDVRDFVLWKARKPEEDGNVYWQTLIGDGRPGWHIECSAMSMKYLGSTFDIHTGGIDLIFPHHQNEIAQSEAASGRKFVNYWLHREHLKVDGKKMSKSAGTGLVLNDVAKTDLDIAAFRYLIISAHYRSSLNFTTFALEGAKKTILHLRNFYSRLEGVKKEGNNLLAESIDNAYEKFIKAMANDLNTPQAMAAVFELISKAEKLLSKNKLTTSSANMIREFFQKIDQIIGVIIDDNTRDFTVEQKFLLMERESARANKDWKRADEIRDILKSQGLMLEDTNQGTRKIIT